MFFDKLVVNLEAPATGDFSSLLRSTSTMGSSAGIPSVGRMSIPSVRVVKGNLGGVNQGLLPYGACSDMPHE